MRSWFWTLTSGDPTDEAIRALRDAAGRVAAYRLREAHVAAPPPRAVVHQRWLPAPGRWPEKKSSSGLRRPDTRWESFRSSVGPKSSLSPVSLASPSRTFSGSTSTPTR
jgi:hypothetical protein